MKRSKVWIWFLAIGILSIAVQQASATIYVSRIGDGTAYSNGGADASAVFVDKFDDSGNLLTTIPMPTAAFSGSGNHPFTLAALSSSNGHMSLSTDGQSLLMGGYDAVPGTGTVRQTTTGRDIAIVNVGTGAVDTTTSTTNTYPGSGTSNNEVRDVFGPNGTQLYMTGSSFPSSVGGVSNGQGGLIYVPYGSTTGTQVTYGPTNLRSGAIVDGNLYASSATTTTGVPHSFIGIAKMANGLPTPSVIDQSDADFQVVVSTAISGSGAASPYDFWFRDSSTVYVADDRQARISGTQVGGGIQKWTFDGSSWNLAYILALPTDTDGMRGLTGYVNGDGAAVLLGTTGNSTNFTTAPLLQDSLVKIVDTGAASTFTMLSTSAANTIYRGVVYVPSAPAGVLGDYNGDGKVNAADYIVWKDAVGGSTLLNRSTGISGTVGAADYAFWKSRFGATSGSGAGLGSSAVPEPASALLMLLGFAVLGCKRRS